MTGELKPAQGDLPQEMADVQRVGGRIKSHIHADRPGGQPIFEGVGIGRVLQQAPAPQISQ